MPPLSAYPPQAAAPAAYGACLLERLPLVVPAEPEWEEEFQQWRGALALRHFKRLPGDLVDQKQSAAEAAGADPSARWQPAALEGEGDRAGDRRSLRRRLDQRVFLLVRPKAGGASAEWTFLAAAHRAGESMRQTAERALEEGVSGEGMQPFFVGNAPAGHAPGAPAPEDTTFFHRCQLIDGVPALKAGGPYSDHAWVAKDELGEYIRRPETLELLQKML